MCGIAGYVDFQTGAPQQSILTGMTEALGRRGPDARGVLVDGPCGLVHTRLSIIDPNGSPQPMAARSRKAALVYNGELYNYTALKAELLEAGEVFATNGDSEVILVSVARDWEGALQRFDGMFAFAVWDGERLLLARDPLGEKPLFYAQPSPGVLVFASEVKALLQHPLVDRDLDEDALRQAVRFRAVYQAGSLHRGVTQLAQGAFLEFSRTGTRIGRFHDLAAEADASRKANAGRSDAQLIAQGFDLFLQSVEERLIADVPVGSFLSGGLDSSMIVAAMRRIRGPSAEIETFSVGFRDDPHSELPHAQLVADAIGTRHTPITIGPETYIERLAELSACRDGPVSEPADVAIAEMSRIARRSVKVALSGEGADEVFAGYPKYALANAPSLAQHAARIVGPANLASLAGVLGLDRGRALIAARSLAQPDELSRIVQWFSHQDRANLAKLLPGLNWSASAWAKTMDAQQTALERLTVSSPLLRMQMVDCLTWLPGNMLERGDRMTMAEGLEVRPPFLDKALAAFGLGLPDNLKVRGKTGKWIVRRWGDDLLPDEILNRKKWGFKVPLNEWFRGALQPMANDYLLSSKGMCATYGDPKQISELLRAHASGEIDAGIELWTLLSVEVWYQDVFLARRPGAQPAAA